MNLLDFSINFDEGSQSLNSDEAAIIIAGTLLIMTIAVIIGLIIRKKRLKSIYGDDKGEEKVCDNVKVVSKESNPFPGASAKYNSMLNTVLFETQDGQRISFALSDKNQTAFDTLVVGDIGRLHYKGKTFISFTRG